MHVPSADKESAIRRAKSTDADGYGHEKCQSTQSSTSKCLPSQRESIYSYQTVTVTLTVKDTHFAINQLCFGTKQLVFDFNAKKKTLTALGFDPGPIR